MNASPVVSILRTHQEAAYAAAELSRAGFGMRKILIVANDYPSREAVERIKHWQDFGSAWVTLGCLNAIGSGIDALGMSQEDVLRCTAALNAGMILVIVKGTSNERNRARLVCSGQGMMTRRVRV